MGIFDFLKKKDCEICGKEVGLLGYKKLEDGEICNDCVKKLSPFFDDRRHSTVEQIKAQLAYREQNKDAVAQLRPTVSYGTGMKVHVDEGQKKFIATHATNWKNDNPDVIDFSQVTSVNTDIKEHKREIYYKDNEGQQKSYSPRRYEYSYEFKAVINVNSPWFDDISFELSDFSNRPDSTYSPAYRDLEYQLNDMASVLRGRGRLGGTNMGGYGAAAMASAPMGGRMNDGIDPRMGGVGNSTTPHGIVQGTPAQSQQNEGWVCESCGTSNTAKFCQNCGAGKPVQGASNEWTCLCGVKNTGKFCSECGLEPARPEDIECSECGWTADEGTTSVPKFCPNCGREFDYNDLR